VNADPFPPVVDGFLLLTPVYGGDTSASGLQYSWWFDWQGDPLEQPDQTTTRSNVNTSYAAAGTYTVRVRVTDDVGTDVSATVQIQVQ
jgi:PKD repeat protein